MSLSAGELGVTFAVDSTGDLKRTPETTHIACSTSGLLIHMLLYASSNIPCFAQKKMADAIYESEVNEVKANYSPLKPTLQQRRQYFFCVETL